MARPGEDYPHHKEIDMFDAKAVQKEAREELAKEKAERAKVLIKDKLKQIDSAARVLNNLRDELNELEKDIGNRV